MMILPIGKLAARREKLRRGVTLIESLAAVVILAVGIVAVYQPMIRSITVLDDMSARLEANRLASNELWSIKNNMARVKSAIAKAETGQFVGSGRLYDYILKISPLTEEKLLNKVELAVYWRSSGGAKQVNQTGYVAIASTR